MKMIVGLGNIGSRYDETRHNSGFMVVEQIARDYQLGAFSHTKYEAVAATGMIDGEKVMLVKPTTFMNDSGRAVKPLMDYYQVDLADLVIVADDLDMPVGRVRLKTHGASGGHNGFNTWEPRISIGSSWESIIPKTARWSVMCWAALRHRSALLLIRPWRLRKKP